MHAIKHNLNGETPSARFDSFIKVLDNPENQSVLRKKYPEMYSQLHIQIEQYQQMLCELFSRLETDISILKSNLIGEIETLQSIDIVGDPHCNGRRVCILTFHLNNHSTKIVYKPRSLQIDQAFYQFLNWLNKQNQGIDYKILKIIHCVNYGWSEFVSEKTCDTLTQINCFYQRLGGLLATMQLFIGSDIHAENVIAHHEFPMLIDLECLLRPIINKSDESILTGFNRFFVTDTHFLPMGHCDFEQSALFAVGKIKTATLGWKFSGTDRMCLDQHMEISIVLHHRPTYRSLDVNPLDFEDAFIAGYRKIYQIICANKKWLLSEKSIFSSFKNSQTRLLIRNTAYYGKIIHGSYHPELLHDAGKRKNYFDEISAHEGYAELLTSEINDLQSGNVPYFSANSDQRIIYDSQGNAFKNKIILSGFERMHIQLKEFFSLSDMENQINIIETSFAAENMKNKEKLQNHIGIKKINAKNIHVNGFSLSIEEIVHYHLMQLMDTMITNKGRVFWPCIKRNASNQLIGDFTDIYLYNGVAGIGVVFALAGDILN